MSLNSKLQEVAFPELSEVLEFGSTRRQTLFATLNKVRSIILSLKLPDSAPSREPNPRLQGLSSTDISRDVSEAIDSEAPVTPSPLLAIFVNDSI